MPFPRKLNYTIEPLQGIPYVFDNHLYNNHKEPQFINYQELTTPRIEPTMLSSICRSIGTSHYTMDTLTNDSLTSLSFQDDDSIPVHRDVSLSKEIMNDYASYHLLSSLPVLPVEYTNFEPPRLSFGSTRNTASISSSTATTSEVSSGNFIQNRLKQGEVQGQLLINQLIKTLKDYCFVNNTLSPSIPVSTTENGITNKNPSHVITEPVRQSSTPAPLHSGINSVSTSNPIFPSKPQEIDTEETGTYLSSNSLRSSSSALERTSTSTTTLTTVVSKISPASIILGKRTRHHTDAYTSSFDINALLSSTGTYDTSTTTTNSGKSTFPRHLSAVDDNATSTSNGSDSYSGDSRHSNPNMEDNGGNLIFQQGKPLPPHISKVLVTWFLAHSASPYPSNEEKIQLMTQTGLNSTQLRNWFTNQRKRHWRPVAKEGRTPRNQMEAILLSTSSYPSTANTVATSKNLR